MTGANDFAKVIEHYNSMVHQNPDDVMWLTNLAWSYERIGQYQEAIQQFRRALDVSQNDFDAHYGLGLALLSDGRPQEALEEFVRARDLVVEESTDRSKIVMLSKQVEVLIRRLS
ncbi:MAG: tetratricopeptide repeat protein [Anaerolineae bacterium]|nr:tetratricopeptide repeat protein [Anaerolineae bacterium]